MDKMKDLNFSQEMLQNWSKFIIEYHFAIAEIETKLEILNEEYNIIHQKNPIEHIKTRIKTGESIAKKLTVKNLEISVENVRKHVKDVAGIRVVCAFVEDIYALESILEKQDDITVVSIKDFIKTPKPNGYRGLHMIVSIPVFLSTGTKDVFVEIQLRTVAMDFWASLEHKIYYKCHDEEIVHIQNRLKRCADISINLENEMASIQKDILDLKKI